MSSSSDRRGDQQERDEGGQFYLSVLLLVFTIPALGGFLFGYDIGATSFAVTQIISGGSGSGVKWGGLVASNSALQGAITSASVFGALAASIAIFKFADDMGRVLEMKIGASLYIMGAIIEALAAEASFDANTGIGVLMTGRIVYGCGIGVAMHAAPAYIGEMSPSHIRGLMISLKEAGIVVGILCGYLLGFILAPVSGGWRYTYGAAIAAAVPMLIGTFFLKESARWLYLKGFKEQARASLAWVLLPASADVAFEEMEEQAEQLKLSKNSVVYSDDKSPPAQSSDSAAATGSADSVWSKRFRPALLAGVGLVFLQQVTGQPSVLYYAASIFSSAGLASVATVGVASFKLVMTLVTVLTVDRFGRKLLLYVGISVMLAALVALTIGFNFEGSDGGGISPAQIVILIAMFVYIGGYQIGFGPISWLLISEVFPSEVRGQAVALAVQTNFFWNVVTTYIFPVETQLFGPSITFLIFTLICAYSLYFVYRYVPETKGLSLEQIEVLLGSRSAGGGGVKEPLLADDSAAASSSSGRQTRSQDAADSAA